MKAPLYRYPFTLTFTSRTKLSRAKVKALLLDALTSGGIDERYLEIKARPQLYSKALSDFMRQSPARDWFESGSQLHP